MKKLLHISSIILLTLVLFWGCTQAPDGYKKDDFNWIVPGKTSYFDIIEVFPSDEPVIKASRSSLEYPLTNGDTIVIYFESDRYNPLIVDKVWLVDTDGTTTLLISR